MCFFIYFKWLFRVTGRFKRVLGGPPPLCAPSRSPDQCWGNPLARPSGALCDTVTKRDPSAHVEFTDLFVSAAAGNGAGMRGGSALGRGGPAPGHLRRTCGVHTRVALRTGPGAFRGCDILRRFHLPFVPPRTLVNRRKRVALTEALPFSCLKREKSSRDAAAAARLPPPPNPPTPRAVLYLPGGDTSY